MPEIPEDLLDERERKRLSNARVAMERGNFEYAIEICDQLLEIRPECLDVRRLLRTAQKRVYATNGRKGSAATMLNGLVTAALGRFHLKKNPGKAIAMAEKVLHKNPYQPKALSLLAHGASEMDLWETEAFCLETICDRYPENLDKLQRYCESLIKIGATDDALAIAEKIVRIKPSFVKGQELVKSASVAHSINQGKWAENKKDFRAKLRDSAKSESLELKNRVAMDRDTGKLALQSLIEEIDHDPQNLDTYRRAIRVCIDTEDYESALIWVEKAIELPGADSDISLSQLRSDLKVARIDLELDVLRKSPDGSKARIEELERELNSTRLVETQKLVEQFPNDYSLRFKFGEQLLESGSLDKAIQQFQIAQRSPSLKLRSLQLLGRSFMKKGLFDLALEQLESANESLSVMDDSKKETLYLMGECSDKLGNSEKAMSYFKSIYASDIGYRDVASRIDAFYKG